MAGNRDNSRHGSEHLWAEHDTGRQYRYGAKQGKRSVMECDKRHGARLFTHHHGVEQLYFFEQKKSVRSKDLFPSIGEKSV